MLIGFGYEITSSDGFYLFINFQVQLLDLLFSKLFELFKKKINESFFSYHRLKAWPLDYKYNQFKNVGLYRLNKKIPLDHKTSMVYGLEFLHHHGTALTLLVSLK